MVLERVAVHNFRSYSEREFHLSPQLTIITGRNGSGKTNLLEAIYTLFQGKSFRDSDEQLLRYNTPWWKIQGVVDGVTREIHYTSTQPVVKQVVTAKQTKTRFTYKQQLPIVLFEPEHLSLVHGTPSLRRQYIDTLLTTLLPTYRTTLAKYERALLQRNNILKKKGSIATVRDSVFVWDIALAEYGAQILSARRDMIETLNRGFSDRYSLLAGVDHTIHLLYKSPLDNQTHNIAQLLHQSLELDLIRGFTSVGPHRDDIVFILNQKDAKITASRGEVRTIILALKQLELHIVQQMTGQTPLLLLDDVFSELDTTRQRALIQGSGETQTVMTTIMVDRHITRHNHQSTVIALTD